MKIDVLVVTSRAYSHRKIAKRLIEKYFTPNNISSIQLKITDDVPIDFTFRHGLFIITLDRFSLASIVKFFPLVKYKYLYVTLEGIPILDKYSYEVLKHVDVIIANSEYTRDIIETFFNINVDKVVRHEAWTVKPNIKLLNDLYRWKGDKKMVLWVSTNQHRKGIDKLAEVTRHVAELDDNIVFRVVTGLGEVNLKALGFSGNTYLDIRIESLSEELTPRYRPFTEYVWNTVPVRKVYYVNYLNYMLMEYHDYSSRLFAKKLIDTVYSDEKCGEAVINTYGEFLKILEK